MKCKYCNQPITFKGKVCNPCMDYILRTEGELPPKKNKYPDLTKKGEKRAIAEWKFLR